MSWKLTEVLSNILSNFLPKVRHKILSVLPWQLWQKSLSKVVLVFFLDCWLQANLTVTLQWQMSINYIRLTALFPGLPKWATTRTVKPIWILLKQETVSGSGISWAICKSAPHTRQITTPAPHHSVFLQAGCPSCRPTNSIKALKASDKIYEKWHRNIHCRQNGYNCCHNTEVFLWRYLLCC